MSRSDPICAGVAEGTDELKTFSGLATVLWTDLRKKWPIEVVADGSALTRYQAAALAAALTRPDA